MKLYNQLEAQQKINQLAHDDKEFVFVVSYDKQQTYICETDEIDAEDLLIAFPHFNNIPPTAQPSCQTIEFQYTKPDRDAYERAINLVKHNQRMGNSYLANLTCKVPITTNLSLRDIFLRSEAKYRLWLRDEFVCFSPEIFVRIEGAQISSYPMKGTINALLPNAEELLMSNAKETAEHATIVDLIRNDLSIVAEEVSVTKYRYIDRLSTHKSEILQTSSEITGNLLPYYQNHIGELLFSMLPAGSITGAPKAKTVEIITEAEQYDRKFYTGVMGYWHKGTLDSAVMIRFIDKEDGNLFYKAGGGITAKSDNDDEYNEVIEKIYVPIH